MSGSSERTAIPQTLSDSIWIDAERLSGAPAFRGTRVPIKNLFDYIQAGKPIDVFLDHFPGVTREQVTAVIEHASQGFFRDLRSA